MLPRPPSAGIQPPQPARRRYPASPARPPPVSSLPSPPAAGIQPPPPARRRYPASPARPPPVSSLPSPPAAGIQPPLPPRRRRWRRKHLPAPGTDVLILRCGPGPMNKAMEAHMDALGYTNGQQFQF